MSQLDPKQLAEFLVSTMEYEIGLTMGVFDAVPADRQDYRPDPSSKSALGLLRHITLEDEWLLTGVVEGKYDPPPSDGDACGIANAADAKARYAERIPPVLSRIRNMSPEDLTREVDFFGKIKMPAIGFLSLAMRHQVHHRGQLSTYLRPMGSKVPGIYGPTADTAF